MRVSTPLSYEVDLVGEENECFSDYIDSYIEKHWDELCNEINLDPQMAEEDQDYIDKQAEELGYFYAAQLYKDGPEYDGDGRNEFF